MVHCCHWAAFFTDKQVQSVLECLKSSLVSNGMCQDYGVVYFYMDCIE